MDFVAYKRDLRQALGRYAEDVAAGRAEKFSSYVSHLHEFGRRDALAIMRCICVLAKGIGECQADRELMVDYLVDYLYKAARLPHMKAVEDFMISYAIEAAGGNKSKAARLLGVSRVTIHRRLGRYTAGVNE